jgi:hypothetical protein
MTENNPTRPGFAVHLSSDCLARGVLTHNGQATVAHPGSRHADNASTGQGGHFKARAAHQLSVPIPREKQRQSQTRWGSRNYLARARNGPFLGALLGSLAPAREQGGS